MDFCLFVRFCFSSCFEAEHPNSRVQFWCSGVLHDDILMGNITVGVFVGGRGDL